MIANESVEVDPNAVHTEMLADLFDRGVRLLLKHIPSVRCWGQSARIAWGEAGSSLTSVLNTYSGRQDLGELSVAGSWPLQVLSGEAAKTATPQDPNGVRRADTVGSLPVPRLLRLHLRSPI